MCQTISRLRLQTILYPAAYHNEVIEKTAITTQHKYHSHSATYHLNSLILNKLKEKVSSLKKETFWSDRCSSQFTS